MDGDPFWFFAHYGDYERGLSSTMIAVAMLGMGASLSVRDFANALTQWRGFAVGMFTQIVLIPVWAAIMLSLMALVPAGFGGLGEHERAGIAIGIALMAAMPGGSASNLFTYLGKGNIALSVALTAVTTFLCLVTTPVVVELLIEFQVPGTIEIDPVRVVLDIALFLIIPLIFGMILGPVLGIRRILFTRIMVRLSLAILGIIIIGSVGAGRLDFPRYGWVGPAAIIAFCVVTQQIARGAAHVAAVPASDRVTIIIEVTLKNVLLAVLLLTTMFPGGGAQSPGSAEAIAIAAVRDGCTYTVLFYGGVILVAGAIEVFMRRAALARSSPA